MTWSDFNIKRYKNVILPLGILILLIKGASAVCNTSFTEMFSGLGSGISFMGHLFPPDWSAFPEMLSPAFTSIVIALLGTIFGCFLSLVIALLAAINISNGYVRNATRFVIGIERSLPEIVILLLFVAAFGLGPMPGILALAVGCIGMVGKLLADSIEEIDQIMIDSMQSVGANKLQVIFFGVLPQILPNLISFTLLRFEINIRLSVILGAVGAGGVGYELDYAFNMLEYHRAFTAMLVILVLVFGTEQLSRLLRRSITMETGLK